MIISCMYEIDCGLRDFLVANEKNGGYKYYHVPLRFVALYLGEEPDRSYVVSAKIMHKFLYDGNIVRCFDKDDITFKLVEL